MQKQFMLEKNIQNQICSFLLKIPMLAGALV